MGRVTTSIVWKGSRVRGESLLAAISPDDPDDFNAELKDDGENDVELNIVISSDGLGQSRMSVDDILACLSAAESGLDSIE